MLMNIDTFKSNILESNCYLLTFNNFSIVIDPSVPYEIIKKSLKKPLEYVFITHGHFDHICNISSYKENNIKFCMHKNAYDKLCSCTTNLSKLFKCEFTESLKDE